jgi:hypothetical protein
MSAKDRYYRRQAKLAKYELRDAKEARKGAQRERDAAAVASQPWWQQRTTGLAIQAAVRQQPQKPKDEQPRKPRDERTFGQIAEDEAAKRPARSIREGWREGRAKARAKRSA